MNISNRSLVFLVALTVFLVVGAGALTVVGPFGHAPRGATTLASPTAAVLPIVKRHGGRQVAPKGPLTVELHGAGSFASVLLTCDMYKSERPIAAGKALFESIPLGDCSLRLNGTEAAFSPVYPGDSLKCAAEDAKTVCTGGIATEKAGSVSVASALPGRLEIDLESKGALPKNDLRLRVGTRALAVHLDDGRTLNWKLVVQPEERIEVTFPDPGAP